MDKKHLLRQKALKHYYENIQYYRDYYIKNRDKLLKYNKEYAKRKKCDKNKCTITIVKENVTIYFD